MATTDKMRVVSIVGATGGGTQSLTVAGFGTPTAAILITSRATVDATVNGYGVSIGFTDGTNEFVSGNRSVHGGANAEADRIWAVAGQLGWVMSDVTDPLNGDSIFSFSQWVTDGIEITWGVAPSTAIQVVAILIQCANAQVGSFDSSATQDVATTITMSPSFAPQTVFIAGNDEDDGIPETAFVYAQSLLGVADYNGSTVEQGSIMHLSVDGAAAGDPYANIWTNRVRRHPTVGTESLELENFVSNAFDATTRDGNSVSQNIGYLALAWNTADRRVTTFDAPTGTATVNKSFTWPGFTPQCVIQALTMLTATDTQTTDANAGSQGIGIFDKDGGEECIAWADEDAAATINTESTHAANALVLHTGAGAALFDANIANGSMDATGYTLEFTTIPAATTRKWLGFALQDPPVSQQSDSAGIGIVDPSTVLVQVEVGL